MSDQKRYEDDVFTHMTDEAFERLRAEREREREEFMARYRRGEVQLNPSRLRQFRQRHREKHEGAAD